jgi:hypothetical protein
LLVVVLIENMNISCKERVADAFNSRMSDLRKLCRAGCGVEVKNLGRLEEYGLCVDRVAADTFGTHPGYWRYQISWGGPAEEFRYYDQAGGRVEFWFLDWGDGASVKVKGRDAQLIKGIIEQAQLSISHA